VRKDRLGLGAFLENGEYITWNQLQIALGLGKSGSGYKNISWIENRDFPIKTKRVDNNSFKVVYLEDFWEWAGKNRSFIDFSKMEENILGLEPEWVKEQRKIDYKTNTAYKTIPWTESEDKQLLRLLREFKYSYLDLSKKLNRTSGAIQRRICDLRYRERPIKADNHNLWTPEEFKQLEELIKQGTSYPLMAEVLGKSDKAIRGRVYQMYLTENLDKVRAYISNGSWGDNRPERTIKQRLLMNIEEKEQVKEDLSKLAGLIRAYAKTHYDYNDYWQKDICIKWDDYCTENETCCDSCTKFVRIRPQYCVRCGKTFFERHESKICKSCREQRIKQFKRKYAVMAARVNA
jgi:hypothetical protein